MTTPIALTLLFVFTTTVAILITIWMKRAETRVEKITTMQAQHVEELQQTAKENKVQIWSIIDEKTIPWSELLDTSNLLIHEKYTPCKEPLFEIETNDD